MTGRNSNKLAIMLCLLLAFVVAENAQSLSAMSPPSRNDNLLGNLENPQPQPLPFIPPERTAETSVLPSSSIQSCHTAIILNINARSVTRDLVPMAECIFGKDNVFVTNTEEEGRRAAAELVQRNLSLVLPVGGDGTLSSFINFMCDAIRAQHAAENNNNGLCTVDEAMKELPFLGYIPLGTGNGVGYVVGAQVHSSPLRLLFRNRYKLRQCRNLMQSFHDIGEQLKSSHDEDFIESSLQLGKKKFLACDLVELPMMEVSYPSDGSIQQQRENKAALCFFAGTGFDSLMLQDFQTVKKWSIRNNFMTRQLSSVAGYCVALVVRTLPKCLLRQEHNIHVHVTTRDPDALWVDHRRGDVVRKISKTCSNRHRHGEDQGVAAVEDDERMLVYKGPTGILAAGSSPYYGGGLRLFPFARMTTDKMHLRLGRINPLRGFFNIPEIFAGSYRDKRADKFGCLDYIADEFEVQITAKNMSVGKQLAKGFPVQHSGESVGYFERFKLRVVKEPVKFVTFLPERLVVDDSP